MKLLYFSALLFCKHRITKNSKYSHHFTRRFTRNAVRKKSSRSNEYTLDLLYEANKKRRFMYTPLFQLDSLSIVVYLTKSVPRFKTWLNTALTFVHISGVGLLLLMCLGLNKPSYFVLLYFFLVSEQSPFLLCSFTWRLPLTFLCNQQLLLHYKWYCSP